MVQLKHSFRDTWGRGWFQLVLALVSLFFLHSIVLILNLNIPSPPPLPPLLLSLHQNMFSLFLKDIFFPSWGLSITNSSSNVHKWKPAAPCDCSWLYPLVHFSERAFMLKWKTSQTITEERNNAAVTVPQWFKCSGTDRTQISDSYQLCLSARNSNKMYAVVAGCLCSSEGN